MPTGVQILFIHHPVVSLAFGKLNHRLMAMNPLGS
jgi:hypothetical protein